MSKNKLILLLSVLFAFQSGIFLTLWYTGAIQTQYNAQVRDYAYQQQPMVSQEAVITPKDENNPKPEVSLASRMLEMLKNDFDQLSVIGQNSDKETAINEIHTYLKSAPAIQQGSGSKEIFVLFDPLCEHCHNFYRSLASGYLTQYDLTVNWVPAVAFLEEPKSILLSSKLSTAVIAGEKELANIALDQLMMNGNVDILLKEEWVVSEEGLHQTAKATTALLQSAVGTPMSVYRNKQGELEVIEGVLEEAELSDIAG